MGRAAAALWCAEADGCCRSAAIGLAGAAAAATAAAPATTAVAAVEGAAAAAPEGAAALPKRLWVPLALPCRALRRNLGSFKGGRWQLPPRPQNGGELLLPSAATRLLLLLLLLLSLTAMLLLLCLAAAHLPSLLLPLLLLRLLLLLAAGGDSSSSLLLAAALLGVVGLGVVKPSHDPLLLSVGAALMPSFWLLLWSAQHAPSARLMLSLLLASSSAEEGVQLELGEGASAALHCCFALLVRLNSPRSAAVVTAKRPAGAVGPVSQDDGVDGASRELHAGGPTVWGQEDGGGQGVAADLEHG